MSQEPSEKDSHPYTALVREDPSTSSMMDSVSLLTGLYGSRGERIRHVAHTGALQLPADVLPLLATAASSAAAETLPALDSVPRPSVAKQRLLTTKIQAETVTAVDATTGERRLVSRTRAWNHVVDTAPAVRLRGGGDDGEDNPTMEGDSGDGSHSNPGEAAAAAPPPAASDETQQQEATSTAAAQAPPVPAPMTPAPSGVAPPAAPSQPPPAPVPVVPPVPVHVPPQQEQQQPPDPSLSTAATTNPPTAPAPVSSSTATSNAMPPTGDPPAPATTQVAPTTTTTTSSAQPVQQMSETATPPLEPGKDRPVVVKGLEKVPAGQWEQHKPTSSAGGGTADPATAKEDALPKPAWFQTDQVSDFEIAALPEWFDGSARHRTGATYLQARNQVLLIGEELGTKYVTGTLVRRSIPGDAGSLLRLHEFLNAHALINQNVANESAPTPSTLLGPASSALYWNADLDHQLLDGVVSQAREQAASKKARNDDTMDTGDEEGPAVDWEAIAKLVGRTALQCEQRFLTMPPSSFNPPAGSVTPDVSEKEDAAPTDDDKAVAAAAKSSTTSQTKKSDTAVTPAVVQEWVMDADPSVVRAVVSAATQHTTSLPEAQKAALAGLHLSKVAHKAHSTQDALAHVVSHVVDLRMQKLEARLALLDDVEGLLDAERVALELERRDLYTARCRHWFGGP